MYAIRKNVPKPAATKRGGRPTVYPFDDTAAVGDSFVVTDDVKRTTVLSAAQRAGKRLGAKFSVGTDPETGKLAVWRDA